MRSVYKANDWDESEFGSLMSYFSGCNLGEGQCVMLQIGLQLPPPPSSSSILEEVADTRPPSLPPPFILVLRKEGKQHQLNYDCDQCHITRVFVIHKSQRLVEDEWVHPSKAEES